MNAVLASSLRTRKVMRVQTAARLTGHGAVAALVGALVLGILGMHALATHGTPPVPKAASSVMTDSRTAAMSGMDSSSHAAAMASGRSHDNHAQAAAGTTTEPGGTGHGMTIMVMLCIVMLAAAALTLLALLVTGFLRPLWPDAFKPAVVHERALQWVRGTGPPHEWQFSVIRC